MCAVWEFGFKGRDEWVDVLEGVGKIIWNLIFFLSSF